MVSPRTDMDMVVLVQNGIHPAHSTWSTSQYSWAESGRIRSFCLSHLLHNLLVHWSQSAERDNKSLFSSLETSCNVVSNSIQLGLININISPCFILAVMIIVTEALHVRNPIMCRSAKA